jgi:hypothetical protein
VSWQTPSLVAIVLRATPILNALLVTEPMVMFVSHCSIHVLTVDQNVAGSVLEVAVMDLVVS